MQLDMEDMLKVRLTLYITAIDSRNLHSVCNYATLPRITSLSYMYIAVVVVVVVVVVVQLHVYCCCCCCSVTCILSVILLGVADLVFLFCYVCSIFRRR